MSLAPEASDIRSARWEWRTFNADLGAADNNIRAYPCSRIKESSELYLMSKCGSQNTKIRDGLMNIKVLLETNSLSLERWVPSIKSSFPLDHDNLNSYFEAANLDAPSYNRETYSLDQVLAELIHPIPALRVVAVHKKRFGYLINEAIVEIAELIIDGRSIRTAAVEHLDPGQVWETVCRLGLEDFENINYVRGIRRVIGW